MGNNTSAAPKTNLKEYYSDKEIEQFINRMLLQNNNVAPETDTLNFNNVDTDNIIIGGSRKSFVPKKNRYERYQNGGYDSELYSEINSETVNANTLRHLLKFNDNETPTKYVGQLLNTLKNDNMTGGTYINSTSGPDSDEYRELTSDTVGTATLRNHLVNMRGGENDSEEYQELTSDTVGTATLRNQLLNMTGGNCPCQENNLTGGSKEKKSKKDSDDELDEDEDDELEEDIDDDDDLDDEESEPTVTKSSLSRSSRSSKSSKSHKKNKSRKFHSEYSLTDTNSSTINIVPFYSSPSETGYYSHLKNKNRFS